MEKEYVSSEKLLMSSEKGLVHCGRLPRQLTRSLSV